ncbi:hypothetical protein Bca101_045298 [Brassica carinata]
MPSRSPYTRRRSVAAAPPSVSPRSKGGFFYKSILFALFLFALPLFPSQTPEFVGETVLTKFWELIHLLFVGIAVAYGLFSRRSVESSVDSRMRSRVVDESSLSYVSSFFPVSSVFNEDSCDFRSDESRMVHVSARGSVAVVNELEQSLSEYGKVNQVQAWNSQYYQGRSKVVVARPAYGLDGHVVHQPLGLPVRSLRSGLRDNAAPEDSSCDEAVNEEAEESLADQYIDEFMAAPSSPPIVPWHSRPEMMAMGDNYLSNFQPLSVDETHYGTLESRSSQSTVSSSSSSSSSRTSFESHTQNRLSPSRSVSEESLNSNVDEPVKEKSLEGSSRSSSPSLPPSPPLSPPPPVVTDDTHKLVLHSRHYSDGSLLEEDVRKELEDGLEGSDVRGRRTEKIFSKKELGSKSLKLTAELSRKGKSKSRRSYPPDPISSPASVADDSTTRRRDRDDHLLEDTIRKGLESDHNKLRVKKGGSQDSLPPSPPLVIDDTHKRVLHSRHYSDGSLLEEDVRKVLEDELEGSDVRGRRTEKIFSKKEMGSKSLKLTAESSRKGKSKSRRSYPPDPISYPASVADDSTTRSRDRDDHLLEDTKRKGLESDHNKLRVKKGRSQDSLPPSPPVVIDDTHKRVLHSRHYSDGSLLEEDELEVRGVRGRRTEIFSKKELGSKSLKLTAESSWKGKIKSSRSYPPDSDDSTTRVRDFQHKSDDNLLEDSIRKGLEADHNNLRVKKGRSHQSLELTAEASSLTIPAVDVQLQPKNAKASGRSSRGGRDTLPVKDIKRNSEDEFVDLDKSRKKDIPGDNKEVKSNPQSWRGSSKVASRGKSVRTIRSDRHGKHLKTDGVSSHGRTEPKAESHGRTKPRRQWKDELAIVLHQEKLPETRAKSEPEDDDDVTEETKVEQLQLTLEEEEEAAAAWESQSNASHDHYEVDRKADEFIAKFREQIRLQKLHSGEQPRGGGGGIGIIRNSHFR